MRLKDLKWYISKLAAKYHTGGLEAITESHYGGNRGPFFSAAKAVDFTIAVVAMFTLQMAMLDPFGKGARKFAYIIDIATGSAATAVILGIATYMIIHSRKQIETLECSVNQYLLE